MELKYHSPPSPGRSKPSHWIELDRLDMKQHFMLPITLLFYLLSSGISLKVTNPETRRLVQVNGPTFCDLLESGYVHHDGALHPIEPGLYTQALLSTAWTALQPCWSGGSGEGGTESDRLLFVDKASGLLSVPGREQSDCLISRVQSIYPTAKVCHRLDRDTSGIIVLALEPSVHIQVSQQFETRQATKVYTALVEGHVRDTEGLVDLPIGKASTEEGFNRWIIGGIKPREAKTEWKVDRHLKTKDGFKYTRLLVKPLTGRGQQIRLHMKALGHPILGDTLHAPAPVASATPRLCLHATTLGFHLDERWVEASSPVPF